MRDPHLQEGLTDRRRSLPRLPVGRARVRCRDHAICGTHEHGDGLRPPESRHGRQRPTPEDGVSDEVVGIDHQRQRLAGPLVAEPGERPRRGFPVARVAEPSEDGIGGLGSHLGEGLDGDASDGLLRMVQAPSGDRDTPLVGDPAEGDQRGPTYQPIGMRGRPGDDLERARVRDVLEDPQRLR